MDLLSTSPRQIGQVISLSGDERPSSDLDLRLPRFLLNSLLVCEDDGGGVVEPGGTCSGVGGQSSGSGLELWLSTGEEGDSNSTMLGEENSTWGDLVIGRVSMKRVLYLFGYRLGQAK